MTPTKYKDKFVTEIIELAKQGLSDPQCAAEFGISKTTLREWAKKDSPYPEFRAAYAEAKTAYEAYWEKIGQQGIKGVLPKFNAAAWVYNMKVRCYEDWRDESTIKTEVKNDITAMSSKEIDEQIRALLAQRQKMKESGSSGTPAASE